MRTSTMEDIVESYMNGNITATMHQVKAMHKRDFLTFLELCLANGKTMDDIRKLLR